MAALKAVHDTQEEIPENYRELYTEKDSKWELTGITGIKTAADVARVVTSLEHEKNNHKETKVKLAVWGDLVHDDVVKQLDRMPELEAAATGKLDDAKIEEIVTRRVEGTIASKLAPLERENKTLKTANGELTESNGKFVQADRTRTVHDHVRTALVDSKVLLGAHDDALLQADRVMEIDDAGKVVTRDQVGVTPGLDPAGWLTEIQPKKEHWWPPSVGGGARGSTGGAGGPGGTNPWTDEGWNMTKQGQILTEHGPERAAAMAKAAGTTVGGPRPKPKKTATA